MDYEDTYYAARLYSCQPAEDDDFYMPYAMLRHAAALYATAAEATESERGGSHATKDAMPAKAKREHIYMKRVMMPAACQRRHMQAAGCAACAAKMF